MVDALDSGTPTPLKTSPTGKRRGLLWVIIGCIFVFILYQFSQRASDSTPQLPKGEMTDYQTQTGVGYHSDDAARQQKLSVG
jgi:hypothetical protein